MLVGLLAGRLAQVLAHLGHDPAAPQRPHVEVTPEFLEIAIDG